MLHKPYDSVSFLTTKKSCANNIYRIHIVLLSIMKGYELKWHNSSKSPFLMRESCVSSIRRSFPYGIEIGDLLNLWELICTINWNFHFEFDL